MTAAIDTALEACGRMSEESLSLCDAAADLEDERLSAAVAEARRQTLIAGQRITELRRQTRPTPSVSNDPRDGYPLNDPKRLAFEGWNQ